MKIFSIAKNEKYIGNIQETKMMILEIKKSQFFKRNILKKSN